MNQEKIGRFIANLRKEKNITQTELAKRIGVSNKTISKWETGRGIPDYGVFESLCKEFNINVNELLNGEKNKTDSKVLSEYLDYKSKQNRKKHFLLIIICLLTILIMFLSLYFFNSYKKYVVYELNGNSENFNYYGGLLYLSNVDTIFQKGIVDILDKDNVDDIYEVVFAIKKDNKYYNVSNLEKNGEISAQKFGYDDEIAAASLSYLPNDLYLLIYYSNNGEVLVDEIKITNREISVNNRLFDFKKEHIGKNERQLVLVNLNKYSNLSENLNYFISNDFQRDEERCKYGSYCLIKQLDDNSYIMVDYKNELMFYSEDYNNVNYTVYEYNYGNKNPSVILFVDDENKNVSCRIEYEFFNNKVYDKGGCSDYIEQSKSIGQEIDKYFYNMKGE